MKTRIFKCSLLPSIGFLLFSTIGLAGCESSTNFVSATVRLNKSEIRMNVGDTEKIVASVSKGYDSELRWFTSNESVAYADDGYVFGTGEGEATITAAYGGGYATCKVIVSDGGGGSVDTPKLNLNVPSQTIKVGGTFDLKVTSVYPVDTTVTFTSGNTSIASIEQLDDMSVRVTGEAEGSAGITVKGSNGVTKVCQVNVSDGGVVTEYDIAVETDLKYTGSLSIGSPKNQRTFMEGLLKDFNTYTGSSIKFTIIDFEEDNGTSGYNTADAMPAVFPYASDQTMTLSQFKALGNVPNDDVEWIIEKMGTEAYDAASLNKVVCYPFAADNGLVMFYNKSVITDPSTIDTMPKIFALADAKGEDIEINYPLNNGFYIAPALMTYNEGKPLYEVEPAGESYTATSNFNSPQGLKAAKDIRNIINNPHIRNATDAPRGDVLVTITDSSKVSSFKKTLGDNYAVAPLPYMDEAMTARVGSFLGYKFYGVNLQLSQADQPKAQNVAKFLCSEYAQYKRFKEYNVRPTLLLDKIHTEFKTEVLAEPHIAALITQSENNGVIPMKAVSSSLWSQTMVTYTDLKKLSASASDSEYEQILKTLDKGLNKKS